MFSRTVPLNSAGSCGTIPMAPRSSPEPELADVDPVEPDAPRGHVPEARQQRDQGGLARPGRPHQGHDLARGDPEGMPSRIAAASGSGGPVPEATPGRTRPRPGPARAAGSGAAGSAIGLALQQLEDPLGRAHRLLVAAEERGQRADRRGDASRCRGGSETRVPAVSVAVQHQPAALPEHDDDPGEGGEGDRPEEHAPDPAPGAAPPRPPGDPRRRSGPAPPAPARSSAPCGSG